MIIDSLLDTDLYKFTMMQVVLHRFPGAMVEYRFKCRNEGVDLRPFAQEIREGIDELCTLRFSEKELEYLRGFSFFKDDFIEFFRVFKLNPNFVVVESGDEFGIVIRGPWLHTIMFEVPVLAIVGEIYYRTLYPNEDYVQGRRQLDENIKLIKNTSGPVEFHFSEFGTRRRFSKVWQHEVVGKLASEVPEYLTGTSNVWLAKEFGIKPIGTMAHEYIQACQSLGPRVIYSQKFAFENWVQEYRGELGIALSDTYSLDAFINDFDLYFCKLFDGARQDSGDPIEWGDRVIAHYEKNRVDPRTKSLVFTDCLTVAKAIEIYDYFKGRADPAFGIGTHLVNDIGHEALQNVIKMVECNGQPVAKISDSPEKSMCRDESYFNYLKQVFKVV